MLHPVRVQSVSHRWGGRTHLHQISFALTAGSLLTLVGPPASGKSTLIRIVAGALRPDGGQVLVADRPRTQADAPGHGLGVQLETEAFPRRLTGEVLLRYAAHTQGLGQERCRSVRRMTGLEHADITPSLASLTPSVRFRTLVAIALLASPRALVLDSSARLLADPEDDGLWLGRLLTSLLEDGVAVLLTARSPEHLRPVETVAGPSELVHLPTGHASCASPPTAPEHR